MSNKFDWFVFVGLCFIVVLGFMLMIFGHDFSGILPLILGSVLMFVWGKRLFKERKK